MRLYIKPPLHVEVLPDGTWVVEAEEVCQCNEPLSVDQLVDLSEEDIETILSEAAPLWPDINV